MSPNVIGGLSLSTVDGLRKAASGVGGRVTEERIVSLCKEVSLIPQ